MLARSRPYAPFPSGAPRPRAAAFPVNDPSMTDSGDPALRLLRAVAERADRTAFAELFGLFAPKVKSYLLRLGHTALAI